MLSHTERVEAVAPGLSRIATVHPVASCCFCKNPLVKIQSHWWCCRAECREIQRRYAIAFREDNDETGTLESWWHVPLPKQALVEMQTAPNVMYAGAAGPGKSFWGRRRLLRRAIAYPGYRGLIVRKQLTELQSTHLSYLPNELRELEKHGIKSKLKPKHVEFPDRGSVIQFGHLSDKRALSALLSTDYDDILADECSVINPEFLPELFSRARTTNPDVIADGGSKALPVTNPGGEASQYLVDMFIDHAPDFEKFPQLREDYKPEDWVYIEATLDDNPYLEPDYAEKRLANLTGVRYQQLRYANWKTFDGQFFTQWREQINSIPWHLQEVTLI